MQALDELVLDPTLHLYLPLWKRDGNQFIDGSASGRIITVTGATWTAQGRRFNGTSDYLVTDKQEPGNANFTVLAWVKPDVVNNDKYVVSHGGEVGSDNAWSLGIGSGATVRLTFHGVANYVSAMGPLVANIWQMIGCTLNGTILEMYNNGLMLGVQTVGVMTPGSHPFSVGNTPDGAGGLGFWGGSCGDVLHYDRILTRAEIHNAYVATKDRYR